MSLDLPRSERYHPAPPRHLAPFIADYRGYRYTGIGPGTHVGMPSANLTVVISLGPPTRLDQLPDPKDPPEEFVTLASGLHAGPVVIGHDGDLGGVQLDLTPAGARSLLEVPAAELAHSVVGLDEVVGPSATLLVEQLELAPNWPAVFAILDAALGSRLRQAPTTPGRLAQAWDLIVRSGGTARIKEVAAEVGWGRRQLTQKFAAEFGLAPKELARVVRFDRSRRLLVGASNLTFAEVAAACDYYDQAHMAREWSVLAGCSPSTWSVRERPFIQALTISDVGSSAA